MFGRGSREPARPATNTAFLSRSSRTPNLVFCPAVEFINRLGGALGFLSLKLRYLVSLPPSPPGRVLGHASKEYDHEQNREYDEGYCDSHPYTSSRCAVW